MGSKHKGLADLFHAGLKQHREGRRHIGRLYGKMAKAALDGALQDALQDRHDGLQTSGDAADTVFDVIDKKPHDDTCEVSDGHVAAVKRLIDTFAGGTALDAGLVAEAQALERHAAGQLGSLRLWAAQLGLVDALPALDRMRADAVRAGEGFGALAGRVPAQPEAAGRPALTPKQAALIGLR